MPASKRTKTELKKMIEWINNKFGINLNENEISNVKDFSLMWNIFENLICSSNFTITNIEREYAQMNFSDDEVQPYYEYFRDRYIENNIPNEKFNHLRFRRNDREEFVRNVLIGNINEPNNKILAITIIIFRFRNNLFHGLKDFRFIEQQNTNFENANNFLRLIINKY